MSDGKLPGKGERSGEARTVVGRVAWTTQTILQKYTKQTKKGEEDRT